ncbi:uncharacterized protein DS421_14g486460 [Arachis hypogaea]|nr:uncharacterized protein DS421_14g486460 [Arachis hypogaea]
MARGSGRGEYRLHRMKIGTGEPQPFGLGSLIDPVPLLLGQVTSNQASCPLGMCVGFGNGAFLINDCPAFTIMPLSMFINTFPLFHFFVSAIFQISSFFVRAAFLRSETSASSNLHFWIKGEEPLVDAEFITHLRTHHRICTSEENEPKYELVVPGPEDRASPCEKYGLDDLDEVEAAIVGFFREVWGRAPYLDTRKFLQGSPTFVRSQLDMARKNAQESYQRVQEAKARSRARTGGTRAIVSPPPLPPPPQTMGTQPIVISSTLSRPLPSARLLSEPEKKKRKTLESGSSFDGGVKADALAFVRKNIYPHISMDDVSTPLSSLGLTSKVEELEGRLLSYQEHERELKEEVAKLRAERDSLREKESKLRAQCNMEASLRKTAQESYQSLFQDLVSVKKDLLNSRNAYAELEDSIADGAEEAWRIFKEQVGVIAPDLDLSPLDPDKVVIDGAIVDLPAPVIVSESELKTRGQRIIESPPRSKAASSSSVVPPTSSSSLVVASLPDPGGAPPDSGGGDPSTPLQK